MNLQGLIPDYYAEFRKNYPGAARELDFIFLKRELDILRNTKYKNQWEEKRLEELEEWKRVTQRVGGWR
jgi:hypothetical protein